MFVLFIKEEKSHKSEARSWVGQMNIYDSREAAILNFKKRHFNTKYLINN